MMEILAGILGTENALQKFEKDDQAESYVLSVIFASPDLMWWAADLRYFSSKALF